MGETERYIERLKKPGNDVEEVLEKVKSSKADELLSKRAELEIEKLEAEIRKIKRDGGEVSPVTSRGYLGGVLAAQFADPKKAKEFLSGLSQKEINNLAALMAIDNGRAGAFLQMARNNTDVKDLISIAKLMQPQQQMDMKGIAEVFKAGVEAAKTNQPQPNTMQEGFKYVYETFVKPFQETLNQQNKDLMNARIETLEAKMPPNPMEFVKQSKAIATELGLSEKGKGSEMDLKLEEMRQSHDIDMEKLRWEQQKYMLTQEAERDKWSAIQSTFSPIFAMAGPEIREGLKRVGRQIGVEMDKGQGTPSGQQVSSYNCPSCNAQVSFPIRPDMPPQINVKCPKCGEVTTLNAEQPKPEESTQERKPRRLGPVYR